MAETEARSIRPDVDISNDVHEILVHYPPLNLDRQHVHIHVQGGVVTLSGHVKAPMSSRYLIERAALVPDVVRVDAHGLHNEEEIRLAAGSVVPEGVIVNVRYGTVILNGDLPADAKLDDMVQKVTQIPGVERVITAF